MPQRDTLEVHQNVHREWFEFSWHYWATFCTILITLITHCFPKFFEIFDTVQTKVCWSLKLGWFNFETSDGSTILRKRFPIKNNLIFRPAMSNPRSHACQSKVLCGPASFYILCTHNAITNCLYFDNLKNSTFSMKWSIELVYHVLRTGRFARVRWHLHAKLISSFQISTYF